MATARHKEHPGAFLWWIWRYVSLMNIVTAILEPDADGSLHLPLPAELRHSRVRVEANLQAVDDLGNGAKLASPEMLIQRKTALAELRALGGLKDLIADPQEWQRDIRADRLLPGQK